jgi:hypothetical protein
LYIFVGQKITVKLHLLLDRKNRSSEASDSNKR